MFCAPGHCHAQVALSTWLLFLVFCLNIEAEKKRKWAWELSGTCIPNNCVACLVEFSHQAGEGASQSL